MYGAAVLRSRKGGCREKREKSSERKERKNKLCVRSTLVFLLVIVIAAAVVEDPVLIQHTTTMKCTYPGYVLKRTKEEEQGSASVQYAERRRSGCCRDRRSVFFVWC